MQYNGKEKTISIPSYPLKKFKPGEMIIIEPFCQPTNGKSFILDYPDIIFNNYKEYIDKNKLFDSIKQIPGKYDIKTIPCMRNLKKGE